MALNGNTLQVTTGSAACTVSVGALLDMAPKWAAVMSGIWLTILIGGWLWKTSKLLWEKFKARRASSPDA
jgi:hypothetical protein